jgi:uncharacterized membrane protein YheB (UPF0754 family)
MRDILIFLAPPVIGAVIGFITNVLAIRMLFRPLREIRFLGIRLPFTPGILPRQRHRLAQSIGGMVERELLTAQVLRERLNREDVRVQIRQTLSSLTEKLLTQNPAALKENNAVLDKVNYALNKWYPKTVDALLRFLRRDDIHRELELKGQVILNGIILKLNVFQRFFLSAGQFDTTLRDKMPEIIDELIIGAQNTLYDPAIQKKLTGAAISGFGEKNSSIAALLDISESEKNNIDDFLFEKIMVETDKQIENLLASINIKALVSDRIDSLEMLRVERIILDVLADQLKWIDIFGAILGFLIGLFQVLFIRLLR